MRYDFRILQSLYPFVICRTTSQGIHLTFDDGPHPIATPEILNILRERKIQATFFVTGKNAEKHPAILQQIKSEGHGIGNHLYTHTCLLFKGREFIRKEILHTEEILRKTIDMRPNLFRPPFGYFNWSMIHTVHELGLRCVLWSFDSKDFQSHKLHDLEHRTLQQTKNGTILLFHDNEYTAHTLHLYLRQTLDSLLREGFNFTPLPL